MFGISRFSGAVAFVASPVAIKFAVIASLHAQVPLGAYVNFEGAQTDPIRISSDGTGLFALNSPDNRLSVFDIRQPSSPKLVVEIPVGIEPVSVNTNPFVKGNNETWVVNLGLAVNPVSGLPGALT